VVGGAAWAAGQVADHVVSEDPEGRPDEQDHPVRMSAGTAAENGIGQRVHPGEAPAAGGTRGQGVHGAGQSGEPCHTRAALARRLAGQVPDDARRLDQRAGVVREHPEQPAPRRRAHTLE